MLFRATRMGMAFVAVCVAACGDAGLDRRRAEVADAGRAVMPFDLDATTHVFEKLDDGGRQTVVADAADAGQIALIRSHLSQEAARFARGDFHDPATIHGEEMPGLHELVTGYQRLKIAYRDVERGAEIRYRAEDAALIRALHQWFDAQQSDHGPHAQPQH